MKAILRSINNFSCKLKQSNNLKYNISPKIRSNKFKSISGNGNVVLEDALNKNAKDYKIYGNTKQQILPDGYTQVDYIQSSRTQYIDTGIKGNENTKIIAKVNYLEAGMLIGDISTATSAISLYYAYNNASSINRFGNKSASGVIKDYDYNNIHILQTNKNGISVDGTLLNNWGTVNDFETTNNMFLFRCNSSDRIGSLKLYYCKIYNGNTLVRDFIPCYRNSDNEVGLYDLVNNVFYTNQGTGVFIYGSMAPTPDAPIDMVSCGDRTNNLFDQINATYKNGYYKNDNGEEKITQNSGYLTSYISVKPNTTYTIQGKLKSTNSPTHAYAIYYYNDSKQWISRVVITDNPPYTFTTPNDCYYIQFQYRQDAYDEDTIQIEEGETATSYEPYGYKIPVNVRSENVFSNNIIENGFLLEETGTISANSNYYICKETNIKPLNKYILSENQNYTVSTFVPVRVCAYDKNDNFIELLLSNRRTEVKRYVDEFVVPANTDYILISFRKTDTNIELVESIETNIYLDEPLRKIGEYSDYVDFVNGKVVRNIKEIILNGTETGSRASETSTYYIFAITAYASITNKNSAINCLSNMFLPSATSIINTFRIATSGNLAFTVPLDFVSSYDYNSFKTKLQQLYNNGTPVIINIPLSTPTEESITLPNINLIEGKNIITIGTELQGIFDVQYYSKEIIDISNYKYNLRKVED